MARVNPDDDSVIRYVVRYYRYDPDRHERRHVVEAAFDNDEEMWAWMNEGATARAREAAGYREPVEHYSAAVMEPGYNLRARQKHLERRRARRGLAP